MLFAKLRGYVKVPKKTRILNKNTRELNKFIRLNEKQATEDSPILDKIAFKDYFRKIVTKYDIWSKEETACWFYDHIKGKVILMEGKVTDRDNLYIYVHKSKLNESV